MIEAAFLRDDLPYFTELLGEVITKTRYTSTSNPVVEANEWRADTWT